MYAEHKNYVSFFHSDTPGTEKVTYGRLSEAFKVTDAQGHEGYEYETWNARFVGVAKDKVAGLKDASRIVLTKWSARCPYNKEKKRSFPYIMVMDFELAPPPAEKRHE